MSLGAFYDLTFQWCSWPPRVGAYGPGFHESITYATANDVLIVAAAGNERDYEYWEMYKDLIFHMIPSIGHPASDEDVIAVGTISPPRYNVTEEGAVPLHGTEEPAFFTSSGSPSSFNGRWMVEFAAPGMGMQPSGIWNMSLTEDEWYQILYGYLYPTYPTWIYSTGSYASNRTLWEYRGYIWAIGTSMATPHISGLAAKLWQGSAEATREFLLSIAQDVWTPGYDVATGFGAPRVPSWWVDIPWWWRVRPA